MSGIVHYEKGKGHPLVLLHGYCETHEIWEAFSAELSKTFRVLMPDLPGFGGSASLKSPFSISDVGSKMMSWMDELALHKPVVIGHSLGGYVTLAMVGKDQTRFAGFGLFHSTAYADSDEKKENRNKVIEFVGRNGAKPFIDTFVPGLFYQKDNAHVEEVYRMAMQTKAESIMAYAAAMRDRPSTETVLKEYTRPALIIAGEHDANIPFDHLSAQAQLIRIPFFTGLPNSGHMGMYENVLESSKIVSEYANFAVEFEP